MRNALIYASLFGALALAQTPATAGGLGKVFKEVADDIPMTKTFNAQRGQPFKQPPREPHLTIGHGGNNGTPTAGKPLYPALPGVPGGTPKGWSD